MKAKINTRNLKKLLRGMYFWIQIACIEYEENVLKSMDSKKLRASMYGLEKLHPTCQKCQSRPVEK